MNEIDIPVEAYIPEQNKTLTSELTTDEKRDSGIKTQLAEIVEVAFIGDPLTEKSGVNFIADMPKSMYQHPDNMIIIARDEDNPEVIQGFSFIEKVDEDTYYENIIAVRRQNAGYGTKITEAQQKALEERNARYLIIHVDKDKGYAKTLKEKYETVEPDLWAQEQAQPHQETLKLVL